MRLTPVAATLHESGRGNTASREPSSHRGTILMGGQVALALVLLVSSGLMLRSFQKLRAIDPGFEPSSGLTFRIGLPRTDYADRTRMIATHRAIIERLDRAAGRHRRLCHHVPAAVGSRLLLRYADRRRGPRASSLAQSRRSSRSDPSPAIT